MATIVGDDLDNDLTGTSEDDVIEGRNGNDRIAGGPGDDTIDGGAGTETAIFAGNLADYDIAGNAHLGTAIITDTAPDSFGDDGQDTLTGVRILQFADQTFVFNTAPAPSDDTLDAVQANSGETLIATSALLDNDTDADDDVLTITEVFDANGVNVSLASPNQIRLTPDSGFTGTATFDYRVSDGFSTATASVSVAVEEAEPQGPQNLAIELPEGLAAGETGTAQVSVALPGTVISDSSVDSPTASDTDSSSDSGAAFLVAVSAQKGLVADTLTGNFAETAFVLARSGADGVFSPGEVETIGVDIKGTAGPRSMLEAAAQLADPTAMSDFAARATAFQPAFLEPAVVDRIEANLHTRFGDTVGDLTQALGDHADRFKSFGIPADSATAALAFALEAAGDYGSLEERGLSGSLGQGWASLADLGLSIDGPSVRLDGLADLGVLRALSIDASALYTASASAGRAVSLAGDVFSGALDRPSFEQGVDGRFSTSGSFDGTLRTTDNGYALDTDDGETLVFDDSGVFQHLELADGRQITASHDGTDAIIGLSGPNGAALTFTRDAEGQVAAVADENGRTASFSYDANGQLEGVTRPEGTSSFAYDSTNGDLTQATAPGGITAEFTYDALGRLETARYGGGLQSEDFAYDDAGGLTITDGAGRITTLDLLPGAIAGGVTDGAGNRSELVFDEDGTLTGLRAPDGTLTGLAFDQQGRITTITDANGAELGFTYAGDSERPSSFTDAEGNTRSYTYDDAGRITEATWPDGTALTFTYDADGNLTGSVNRRGDGVTSTYDAQGRLLSQSDGSAGATTYTYDAQGRLVSATNDQGTTTFAYDSADRVTHIEYPTGRTLTYTYNEAGLRSSLSDGGDYSIQYDYDALGRLTALRDENGPLVSYDYDAAGNLIRETNGNGTVTTYDYDDAGRLTLIENRAADDSLISRQAYAYDAAGQRVGMETLDGAWTYGYDAAGQLTSAVFASSTPDIADKNITYEYDAAGNRTRVVEDGVETLYTANALNQYTQVGEATFTYDADGNMTSRTDAGGTTTYAYDLNNRLVSVTEADGTTLEFEYDLLDNRIAKTVDGVRTDYLVDPFGLGDVVAEYTGGTLAATYAHGLGLAAGEIGGETAWFDADAVGSVTTVTDATGAVLNRYAYTPFGTEMLEVEAIANDFEFNGALGILEDSGNLTFMRARGYSDQLGRFVSEDPLFVSGDVQNLYNFALNNPTRFVDPYGNEADERSLSDRFYDWFDPFGNRAADRSADPRLSLEAQIDEVIEAEQRQQSFSDNAPVIAGAIEAIGSIANLASGAAGIAQEVVQRAVTGVHGLFQEEGDPGNEPAYQILKEYHTDYGEIEIHFPPRPFAIPIDPAGDTAASDGDPHLRTFDGVGYSFQAVGEFILFRTQDGASEFQVRQEPWNGTSETVSVNTAITTQLGDEVVGLYAGQEHPLIINGSIVILEPGESLAVGTGTVYFNGGAYIITDEHGNGVWAKPNTANKFMNLRPFINEGSQGNLEGLLGNADGERANDFALRDGTVLDQPLPQTVLYGAFADSWRIGEAESLFVYADGESTETYTDQDFPANVIGLDDLDPEVRATAEQIAIDAGLEPGTFAFETTVLDVALTGLAVFAEAVAEAPDLQEEDEDDDTLPEIVGTAGGDTLAGSDDAEIIRGGGGRIDILTGGGGADQFDFSGLADNGVRDVTRILDWDADDSLIGITQEDILQERGRPGLLLIAYGDGPDIIMITGASPGEDLFA